MSEFFSCDVDGRRSSLRERFVLAVVALWHRRRPHLGYLLTVIEIMHWTFYKSLHRYVQLLFRHHANYTRLTNRLNYCAPFGIYEHQHQRYVADHV